MRLIDADALNPFYRSMLKPYNNGKCLKEYMAVAMNDIEKAPTVDALPVIRCKDCNHWYEKYRHGVDMSACKRAIGYFGANDYCSRAERKEE